MKSPRREKRPEGVFDVHAVEGHTRKKQDFLHKTIYGKNVVNLRPRFRSRHPWILVLIITAVVVVVFVGVKTLFTKGEVQDFSPTTCLGTWENPSAAEGTPETILSASSSFSADNSALYAASGTEIYCGGFVPASISTSGILTNVSLNLVWQAEPLPDTSFTPSSTEEASTSAPDDAAPTTSDETAASTSVTVPPPAPTLTTTTPSTTTSTVPTEQISTPDVTTPSSSPDDSASTTDTSTPPSNPPPTPTPVSTSTDADTTGSSTSLGPFRSFISEFIPSALAQTDASSDISSTIILGPPLMASLAPPTTTPDDADSAASGTVSSTPSTTTALAPPAPAPDEDFLDVSYSTDGQAWVSVGTVNVEDLSDFTVTLPITDWTDLQNLQIRVEGIPTTQDPIPAVYLDGMIMEVHYVLPAPITLTPPPAPSVPKSPAVASVKFTPPTPVKVVDPDAKQTCAITPFSQTSTPGGTLQYEIALTPSYANSGFSLSVGNLPYGVTSTIQRPSGTGAATTSFDIDIGTSTSAGSFNSLVIYQETQQNGTMLSNFCQFNFVVGNQ